MFPCGTLIKLEKTNVFSKEFKNTQSDKAD
jgi:hypothetical protein